MLQVARHYSAAVYSLRVTRAFDACRVLTFSCIAAIADVVARTVAADIPSEFSLHYSGTAEGSSLLSLVALIFCLPFLSFV